MTRIGRLYLTMPLYKAFAKTPEGLAYAEQVYAKAKGGYHPMTQEAVEAVFAKASKNSK
jgi:leukotriene-A4 hydrolase